MINIFSAIILLNLKDQMDKGEYVCVEELARRNLEGQHNESYIVTLMDALSLYEHTIDDMLNSLISEMTSDNVDETIEYLGIIKQMLQLDIKGYTEKDANEIFDDIREKILHGIEMNDEDLCESLFYTHKQICYSMLQKIYELELI